MDIKVILRRSEGTRRRRRRRRRRSSLKGTTNTGELN